MHQKTHVFSQIFSKSTQTAFFAYFLQNLSGLASSEYSFGRPKKKCRLKIKRSAMDLPAAVSRKVEIPTVLSPVF